MPPFFSHPPTSPVRSLASIDPISFPRCAHILRAPACQRAGLSPQKRACEHSFELVFLSFASRGVEAAPTPALKRAELWTSDRSAVLTMRFPYSTRTSGPKGGSVASNAQPLGSSRWEIVRRVDAGPWCEIVFRSARELDNSELAAVLTIGLPCTTRTYDPTDGAVDSNAHP